MPLPSAGTPASTDLRTPLLEADQLTLHYPGGVTALDGVDLSIPGAGITCLLGANGAGKTSLLEIASGLLTPTAGRIEVLGGPPGRPATRLRLGVMLQDGGLPGSARPRDFLTYLARLYPASRDVSDLLASVEIEPSTRTPIRRLSGGQQRRIAWAAAMIGDPAALILDEPTASIDPVGRERLHDLLRAERQREVAMIVSTHLIEDVEALADYIVVLHAGKVALAGTPEGLRPRNSMSVRSARELDEGALLSALPSGSTCSRATLDTYIISVPSGIDASVMATAASWCAQHSVIPDIAVLDLRSALWGALKGEAA